MVNDFELIYLYKQNREETVLQEIIDKYRPLIYKNIYKFYVKQQDIEDFYQEGVLALLQTIEVFNEDVGKTFTKFYELILFRRFIQLKDKSPKYVLYDNEDFFEKPVEPVFDYLAEDIYFGPFEKEVFDLYFIEHFTEDSIAIMLEKDKKQIQNALHRIKLKIRENEENQLK